MINRIYKFGGTAGLSLLLKVILSGKAGLLMTATKNFFTSFCNVVFPLGRPKKTFDSWDKGNCGAALNDELVRRLNAVRPTELQKRFADYEYYTFVHFGMNTCTGNEWGTGKEKPEQFDIADVDTDQWARVIKKSGSRGVIFTAKHHDGFCLFPSAYTGHCIKNSPYKNGKGDIVKELSESCKKFGLLFGVYLSPWDRHESTYGTKGYDDYFVNQLTELCTNYGDIFTFWFDGAKGQDAPDFTYDFERYYKVIRSLQPGAAICNCGPDVRWIGNEAGRVRESEWSVIAKNAVSVEEVMKGSQQDAGEAQALQSFDRCEQDLGSRQALSSRRQLVWSQGEADVSIHMNWFYSPRPRPRTARQLEKIYFRTVGKNALLLLNVPPSKNGIIEPDDVKLLEDFKNRVDKAFCKRLLFSAATERAKMAPGFENCRLQKGDGALIFSLPKKQRVRTLVIREDTSFGQRIERFEIYFKAPLGFRKVYTGTTVGSKRIVRFPPCAGTDEIRFVITQSRSSPVIRDAALYGG